MHHKFIALICSAALALAATSAPARAQDEVAKIVTGLAAIAILGAALHAHNTRDREVVIHTPVPRPPTPPHVPKQPGKVKPRPLPENLRHLDVPRSCMRTAYSQGREVRFLGQGCLNKRYHQVDALPRACKLRFPTRNGLRKGFDPRCLRDKGYRITHR
jgi:hypothetical protein